MHSVIQLGVLCGIALNHVIAETCIAQVVEQVVKVELAVLLHIGAGVVQVACAVKVLAGIVGAGNVVAVARSLVCAADVGI